MVFFDEPVLSMKLLAAEMPITTLEAEAPAQHHAGEWQQPRTNFVPIGGPSKAAAPARPATVSQLGSIVIDSDLFSRAVLPPRQPRLCPPLTPRQPLLERRHSFSQTYLPDAHLRSCAPHHGSASHPELPR